MSTARILAATACVGSISCPPVSTLLEASMATHMLVQIPLLFLSGRLFASGMPRSAAVDRWNVGGIPGLIAVLLVVVYWMTPIAMDRAVISAWWDTSKIVSMVAAGLLFTRSWSLAPMAVQGFFIGNFVWMILAFGLLLQDVPVRLCLVYRQGDQARAGVGMVGLGISTAIVWLASLPKGLGR